MVFFLISFVLVGLVMVGIATGVAGIGPLKGVCGDMGDQAEGRLFSGGSFLGKLSKYRLGIVVVLSLSACEANFEFSPFQADGSNLNAIDESLQMISSNSQNSFAPFKFAAISDTHSFYDEFHDAVDAINNLQDIEFILATGDLTNAGLKQEYQWTYDILSRFKQPYFTAIGNHDALTNGKKLYPRFFGPMNYNFVYRNTKFISLNNNNWEFDNQVPDLNWLEAELIGSETYDYVFVFAHVSPGNIRFHNNESGDRFRALLDDYSVTFGIYGHDHNPKCTPCEVKKGGPTGHVIVGSVEKRGYAIVSVDFDTAQINHVRY